MMPEMLVLVPPFLAFAAAVMSGGTMFAG